MKRMRSCGGFLLLSVGLFFYAVLGPMVLGAEYYVDPQNGKPNNDGSKERPWPSLQALFDQGAIETQTWESLPYKPGVKLVPKNAGATIRPGDTIWLRTGNYGRLFIQGYYNPDYITIAAEKGHTPRFESIHIQSGSHWILRGLHVSPEYGEGKRPRAMIRLESHGWRGPVHDIIVEDCRLQSAEKTDHWSAEDWNNLSCDGILADGERIIVRRNYLKNVNFGISMSGPHCLVEYNTIENFAGDGLRGLGDYGVFQYNVVKNCYDVNANHDDGFQSWSVGPGGVGTGVVKGLVLRGNVIINYEDPQQPHRGALQGIGCFDGMYEDWVIENNVVIVDHYHGITMGGAVRCRIVNNTVLDPTSLRPGPAAVRIGRHKNGTPSRDCIVRNNLVSALFVNGENMVVDHNLIVDDPAKFFVDPARYDLHLRKDAPAIDAGAADHAPERDIQGTRRPQGKAVDIGAYEYPSEG
ncbi:MAG TPA: choice-of-anchor Q domain-containing protein [Thermogutta sp.]|nr:choice-of-anchor Q domain-containing protein [Thermogutta sp.]HPU06810.1 choice-of-anchor Q domain-containing protein [Thermogutta sp.]HQF15399.1 choice-of-anchor Q domain-containing protein [Thermogutta sp.]